MSDRPTRLAALAEWADESASHAASEERVFPVNPPSLAGADAILCAVELLWLAVADIPDGTDGYDDALAALRAVLSEL